MDAARLSLPRRLTVPVNNLFGVRDLSVVDFGDDRRPVDLVFVHANGFKAATYRSILAPLSGSVRILAPDLRGPAARACRPGPPAGSPGPITATP